MGYEIHLATKFSEENSTLDKHNIYIHNINFERYKISPIKDLILSFKLFFLINKIKPHIVHCITIKPVLLGGLALKLLPGIKFVVSISGLGYVFSRSFSIKSILTKLIVKFLYKFSLNREEIHFIFQNTHDLNVVSKILNKKIENFNLIPGSGVDLDIFKQSPLPKDEPIVLFASRLLKSKGIYQFLDAAKKVRGARFVVVGKFDSDSDDCIDKKEIYNWVNRGIIEYWGFKNNMHEVLKKSNIVVFPSYYGEGLPKILAEAAASGRPVITTDHPGCRDAIENGVTGFLVPQRNVESIVKYINILIKSPKECIKMGNKSRELAEKKFDVKLVVETHLDIYKKFVYS